MDGYKHYVRINAQAVVIHGFSDAFEQPESGDICIDDNAGRHFTIQLRDDRGRYRYKYVDGDIVERTEEEMFDLVAYKAAKIAELTAARDAAIYTSFTSSALGTLNTYGYDSEAYANFGRKTAQLALDTTITSVMWYSFEQGFVEHTREQFTQVVRDGANHEETLKMKFFTLSAQVDAAQTAGDVEAIVW